MKIAFLVGRFPSISETFILNQVTGLLDRGYDVDIYCERSRDKIAHSDFSRYNLSKQVYYFDIPLSKITRLLKAVFLLITNAHRGLSYLLKSLNFLTYRQDALSLRFLYITIKFLQVEKKYDLIHCHFGINGRIAALLKCIGLLKKTKILTQFHGHWMRLSTREGKKFYNELKQLGDCNLSISKYNRKRLKDFGFKDSSIIHHPVGIDISKFPFKRYEKQLSSKSREKIEILSIGRLVREKGYEYGIRAFQKCYKENHDTKLQYLIIGDGYLLNKLTKLVKELDLGDAVQFIGPQRHNEVIEYLLRADIFLLPSIAEALPVVLMEAQATGIPVVSTDIGSTNEVILDGITGYLVPHKQVEHMADRINHLIDNPNLWPQMGKAGREHIQNKYDINVLNDRLVDLYKKLISSKETPS